VIISGGKFPTETFLSDKYFRRRNIVGFPPRRRLSEVPVAQERRTGTVGSFNVAIFRFMILLTLFDIGLTPA